MARTRGASGAFHQDDGEVLDKWGKPIPTTRPEAILHLEQTTANIAAVEAVVPAHPAPSPAYEWLCDRTTWNKNMTGHEAMLLLDMYMGGLTITLAPEVFALLSADARQHFRRVARKPEE